MIEDPAKETTTEPALRKPRGRVPGLAALAVIVAIVALAVAAWSVWLLQQFAHSVEAARKQVTAMFLEVAEDNQPALALYRRAGFVANGRRQRYYRRGNGGWVDALMLRANVPLGMGMIGSLD